MECFYCDGKMFDAGSVMCCSSCGRTTRNFVYYEKPIEVEKKEEEQENVE